MCSYHLDIKILETDQTLTIVSLSAEVSIWQRVLALENGNFCKILRRRVGLSKTHAAWLIVEVRLAGGFVESEATCRTDQVSFFLAFEGLRKAK